MPSFSMLECVKELNMNRFWKNRSGSNEHCPDVPRMLKLLSTQLNLEILLQLNAGEKDVTTIANDLELECSNVSRCLRRLHSFSMVEMTRAKKQHRYRLGAGVRL